MGAYRRSGKSPLVVANKDSTGEVILIKRWWTRLWTGWLAGGFTVAGVVIGAIAELTVLDTSENLRDFSLWEHVALLGMFAFIHWIIITTMVVLSLAAPVLGLLAGFVGLIFPAGRTRLNGGSVALCSAMFLYLVVRHQLYRLVLSG